MAGLDPAIIVFVRTFFKWMDARVKPAHDSLHWSSQRGKDAPARGQASRGLYP
jgi:hypothetical protein